MCFCVSFSPFALPYLYFLCVLKQFYPKAHWCTAYLLSSHSQLTTFRPITLQMPFLNVLSYRITSSLNRLITNKYVAPFVECCSELQACNVENHVILYPYSRTFVLVLLAYVAAGYGGTPGGQSKLNIVS